MVGNETGNGHRCNLDPRLCCIEERYGLGTTGISIFKCRYPTLESKPRPDDADAKNQAAAEASTTARFPDKIGGSTVSLEGAGYAPSSPVFPDRLVHRKPTKRDNRP